MNTKDRTARLDVAICAGREAAKMTLEYFRQSNYQVEVKKDGSPVTLADREAESYLRTEIAKEFPDDGIMGEEYAETVGGSGYRWLLDPIDGTKSFVQGVPLYGTLVAVEHEGYCPIGVVVLPALNEYIYAATGLGTWHARGDEKPSQTQVSQIETLSDGLFCTTDVRSYSQLNRKQVFDQLCAIAGLTRAWGDCFGYVLVAIGKAELMIDPVINAWDAGPLQVILEEAGGTFTDWHGNATVHGKDAIGTNGRVLDEVLAITHGR